MDAPSRGSCTPKIPRTLANGELTMYLFVKTCVQQVKPSRHDASLPKFVLDELPRQQIVLRRLELLCRYDFHQQVVFVKRNRTRVSRKAFVLSLPFGMARAAFHSGVARICRTRSNPPPMTAF